MNVPVYDLTVGQFSRGLTNLKGYLNQGAVGLGADYGVTGGGDVTGFDPAHPPSFSIADNVDVTNPFSKAALLQPIQQLLKSLAVAFVVFALINLLFFQGPWQYNSFSESAADVILVIICCYFLFTIVKSNEHFNLISFDYFWLATGLLFYCLGSALLYQFSYLLRDYYEQTKIDIGTYVNYTLNLILHTCLIIAFICRRKTTRLLQ